MKKKQTTSRVNNKLDDILHLLHQYSINHPELRFVQIIQSLFTTTLISPADYYKGDDKYYDQILSLIGE